MTHIFASSYVPLAEGTYKIDDFDAAENPVSRVAGTVRATGEVGITVSSDLTRLVEARIHGLRIDASWDDADRPQNHQLDMTVDYARLLHRVLGEALKSGSLGEAQVDVAAGMPDPGVKA